MLSIIQIRERYKRRRIIGYSILLLFSIFILIGILNIFNVFPKNYNIVIIILLPIIYFVSIFSPEISRHEYIIYHLSELNESLNSKNITKSIYHLNKLAYNLDTFGNELEDSFILYPSKETLKEFWKLLKYQVYPCLMKNDFNSFIEVLKDIYFAFNNDNLTLLNEILKKFVTQKVETNVLLPYEEPPFLNRVHKYIIRTITVSFQKNFIFRLFCWTAILLLIGYYFSTITYLKFDTTLISALILVALGIAKEYK